ncbi:NIPSNAP family protein [Serratia sp. S1B]|nr:NIPSNAP family protein [Serratia sp. S1B]
MKTVEILLYTLKPGAGHEFHQIMQEVSVPLHRSIGMDVVTYGNSLHDNDSYYLIRAYDSLEHLEKSQDEFYWSEAWRKGPREAIIDRILTSVKSVIKLDDISISNLRQYQDN